MLPFMKPKNHVGVIVSTRKPDGSKEEKPEGNHALEACAAELIRAVHAKDEKAVAEALQNSFEILESSPHVEGEHIESKEE